MVFAVHPHCHISFSLDARATSYSFLHVFESRDSEFAVDVILERRGEGDETWRTGNKISTYEKESVP